MRMSAASLRGRWMAGFLAGSWLLLGGCGGGGAPPVVVSNSGTLSGTFSGSSGFTGSASDFSASGPAASVHGYLSFSNGTGIFRGSAAPIAPGRTITWMLRDPNGMVSAKAYSLQPNSPTTAGSLNYQETAASSGTTTSWTSTSGTLTIDSITTNTITFHYTATLGPDTTAAHPGTGTVTVQGNASVVGPGIETGGVTATFTVPTGYNGDQTTINPTSFIGLTLPSAPGAEAGSLFSVETAPIAVAGGANNGKTGAVRLIGVVTMNVPQSDVRTGEVFGLANPANGSSTVATVIYEEDVPGKSLEQWVATSGTLSIDGISNNTMSFSVATATMVPTTGAFTLPGLDMEPGTPGTGQFTLDCSGSVHVGP